MCKLGVWTLATGEVRPWADEGWAGWGAGSRGWAPSWVQERGPLGRVHPQMPGPGASLSSPLPASCPQLLWKEVSWAARAASGPLGLRSTSAPSITRPCPLGHRSQGNPAPGSLQSKGGQERPVRTLVLHVLASPSGQWGKTLFGGTVTYERQGSSPSMTSPTDH